MSVSFQYDVSSASSVATVGPTLGDIFGTMEMTASGAALPGAA